MTNITQPSTYKFEINFEYPDPYTVGQMHPFTLTQEVVSQSFIDAWIKASQRWFTKYDSSKMTKAKITCDIVPIEEPEVTEEPLPPAA